MIIPDSTISEMICASWKSISIMNFLPFLLRPFISGFNLTPSTFDNTTYFIIPRIVKLLFPSGILISFRSFEMMPIRVIFLGFWSDVWWSRYNNNKIYQWVVSKLIVPYIRLTQHMFARTSLHICYTYCTTSGTQSTPILHAGVPYIPQIFPLREYFLQTDLACKLYHRFEILNNLSPIPIYVRHNLQYFYQHFSVTSFLLRSHCMYNLYFFMVQLYRT